MSVKNAIIILDLTGIQCKPHILKQRINPQFRLTKTLIPNIAREEWRRAAPRKRVLFNLVTKASPDSAATSTLYTQTWRNEVEEWQVLGITS